VYVDHITPRHTTPHLHNRHDAQGNLAELGERALFLGARCARGAAAYALLLLLLLLLPLLLPQPLDQLRTVFSGQQHRRDGDVATRLPPQT
jgi:hypothetical protein